MRYRLRTLLIVLALGPMFLAVTYWGVKEWQRRQAVAEARAAVEKQLQAARYRALTYRWQQTIRQPAKFSPTDAPPGSTP